MSSDDLFKKRKARKLRDISRKKRTRELYKRVLIVCEGQKTEPLYFNSLREEYRLQATDICITNAKGSDPMSLVKYAIDLYKNSQKVGNDLGMRTKSWTPLLILTKSEPVLYRAQSS